ncbi:hypothetical protein EDD17DRAFT_812820 [Pisolithus thermaeus]|nr:hypothetical protein EDD17DRAFT_812820 [Pisolithus thermaeus]
MRAMTSSFVENLPTDILHIPPPVSERFPFNMSTSFAYVLLACFSYHVAALLVILPERVCIAGRCGPLSPRPLSFYASACIDFTDGDPSQTYMYKSCSSCSVSSSTRSNGHFERPTLATFQTCQFFSLRLHGRVGPFHQRPRCRLELVQKPSFSSGHASRLPCMVRSVCPPLRLVPWCCMWCIRPCYYYVTALDGWLRERLPHPLLTILW